MPELNAQLFEIDSEKVNFSAMTIHSKSSFCRSQWFSVGNIEKSEVFFGVNAG